MYKANLEKKSTDSAGLWIHKTDLVTQDFERKIRRWAFEKQNKMEVGKLLTSLLEFFPC